MSFYLYTETAFHHEGDINFLFKLIDESKKAGAMGVKFQVLIDIDSFMSSNHSSYKKSKTWLFTIKEWESIFKYTESLGLDIILMPIDLASLKLVNKFNIKYIEIHSVSFKDEILLKEIDLLNTPLILGIGGRTLDEVEYAINRFNNKSLVLMVGFQSFPSKLENVKLERISYLNKRFPNLKIGYADHSSYDHEFSVKSNEYAYILGAKIFEKHITLREGERRIDFESAISSNKIKTIIHNLNYLDSNFNHNEKSLFEMSPSEIKYRDRQKKPVLCCKVLKNEVINEKMLTLKMVDSDKCIDNVNDILGKIALKDLEPDSFLDNSCIN